MARDSTKVMWRVQVRKSRAHKWVNKSIFETRFRARLRAGWLRVFKHPDAPIHGTGYGFGNTRVVRVEKAR